MNEHNQHSSADEEQVQAEMLEAYRLALAANPYTPPPDTLNAQDAAVLRQLSTHRQPQLTYAARQRMWHNAQQLAHRKPAGRSRMAGLVAAIAVFALIVIGMTITRSSSPTQLTQIETGLPFDELPVIASNNLDQLVELADLGSGAIYAINWLNETILAAMSARGILLLDSADLFATPERIPVEWRDVPASYNFSADGRWLAAITNSGVSVYDLTTGEQHAELAADGYRVTAVHINQPLVDTEGRYLTVASVPVSGTVTTRTIQRYALGAEGQLVEEQALELPFNSTGPHEITGLALSPDAQHVMAYLSSGALLQLEFDSGSRVWTQNVLMPSLNQSGSPIVLSPDGAIAALATYNGVVLIDSASGDIVHTLTLENYHIEPRQVTSIRFLPSSDALMLTTQNNGVVRYDWASETLEVFPVNLPVQDIAVNPDQTLIASLQDHSVVTLWDFGMTAPLSSVQLGSLPIASLTVSGNLLIAASHAGDNSIQLADVGSGQVREVTLNTTFVNDMAFSPDGAVLAASLQDFNQFRIPTRTGALALIDLATDEILPLVSADSDTNFSGIAYDADGTLYAVSSRSLQAWERGQDTSAILYTSAHDIPFTSLAVSADGMWAAWSSDNGEVLMVNLATQNSFVYSMPRYESVVSLEFVPGSHLLAVSVFSGSVHFVDADTTTLMSLYEMPEVVFGDAVFAPDGSLLAVQTFDRQAATAVQLWNTTTQERLTSRIPEDLDIRTAQFSADGRLLITGGNDGIIRVWGVAE